MALTARAALAALVAAVLTFLIPALALPLDGLLLIAIAADLALAGPVRALSLTRSGPATVRLGESVVLEVVVSNGGRRRARGQLRDGWVPSAGAAPRVQVLDVPAGERRRLATRLEPTRRGPRRTARVTVRRLGPLGLAGRQGRLAVAGEVVVLPRFSSRRLLPDKLRRLQVVEGRVALRGPGQGTEVDSLRDYLDGDDGRAIDWRATARRGAVVVRTYRPERDRRVVIVVDTGRTSAARVGDAPRLDHALDAALLLAALARRAGDRVEFLAFDSVGRADVRSTTTRNDLLARLTDAMTPLEASLVDPDYRAMVALLARRTRQRCLVVLFTDLAPVVVEESLLPVLGQLTRRHAVVVAALRDPTLGDLAGRRDSVPAVYRAAAAERAVADREDVAGLLSARGVSVVDAPPALFASRVADTYLALKAAGRL
jgi:uncharacterized protein (DUF58 family)